VVIVVSKPIAEFSTYRVVFTIEHTNVAGVHHQCTCRTEDTESIDSLQKQVDMIEADSMCSIDCIEAPYGASIKRWDLDELRDPVLD